MQTCFKHQQRIAAAITHHKSVLRPDANNCKANIYKVFKMSVLKSKFKIFHVCDDAHNTE